MATKSRECGMAFTHWMTKWEDCKFWFDWFRNRGIPAGIIESEGNFAVFRRGPVERKSEHGGIRLIEPKTRIDAAKVIDSCNGYEIYER